MDGFSTLAEGLYKEQGRFEFQILESIEFDYYRLSLECPDQLTLYLYAVEKKQQFGYVLGVFDSEGQLDWFLQQHRLNALNVPALRVEMTGEQFFANIESAQLIDFQDFQGVYRVGYKSYQVVRLEQSLVEDKSYLLSFIDRYKVTELGTFNEKDACVELYNHFFNRLSGCKMC